MDGPYLDKYRFSFSFFRVVGGENRNESLDFFFSAAYTVICSARCHAFQ